MTRLVLALAVSIALAGTVRAASVELNEVRQSLFGSCFVSEQEGWMVGELGRIFHTKDGGTTWERQEAGTKRPFLAITCVDAKTVWLAGKEGIVYGTTDGGATWKQATTGSNRHLFTLAFPTAQRGHAAGDFGTMVHTEDGGATWSVQQVPTEVKLPESALDTGVDPGDVNLYSLSYGDADHAWVVGEFGIIMASDDGGRTWRQQSSPVETTLFGVHFVDVKRGWAVGSDSVIIRTEDGGATWMPQPQPAVQRPFYDVNVNGSGGWIVGEAGTILSSTDGGSTWSVVPLPIQLAAHWIRGISLTPGGHGLIVGAEGLVYRIDGQKLQRLGRDDTERKS